MNLLFQHGCVRTMRKNGDVTLIIQCWSTIKLMLPCIKIKGNEKARLGASDNDIMCSNHLLFMNYRECLRRCCPLLIHFDYSISGISQYMFLIRAGFSDLLNMFCMRNLSAFPSHSSDSPVQEPEVDLGELEGNHT